MNNTSDCSIPWLLVYWNRSVFTHTNMK